jgi:hypothetical protein
MGEYNIPTPSVIFDIHNNHNELEIFRDMVESYKSGKPVCKL